MPAAIGGRIVATFNVADPQVYEQSNWQFVAQNVLLATGGPIVGIDTGPAFEVFVEQLIDQGSSAVVRVVFSDVSISGGTLISSSLANAVAVFDTVPVRTALAAFSSSGVGSVTFSTCQFESWGIGFIPGP